MGRPPQFRRPYLLYIQCCFSLHVLPIFPDIISICASVCQLHFLRYHTSQTALHQPSTKHSRPSTKHSRNFHDPAHMAGKTDKIKSTSLCIVKIALVAILITISSERTFIAYYANNSVVVSLYSRKGSSLDQEQDVRSQYLRLMQQVGDTLDHQAKRIEELDCKIVDLEAAMMEWYKI